MLMQAPVIQRRQSGSLLIEALIAIVIFSVGILGLISLQANAIALSTDAKYRADAAMLGNQLMARLAIADPSAVGTFAHQPSGTTPCSPTGNVASSPTVNEWLAEVDAALPGADSSKQQITVDTSNSVVTATICWKPVNGTQHMHTVTTQMQWQ